MRSEILKPTPENLSRAAQALARGELVAIPTETVYGLAANAFSNEAVAKVFAAKERPTFDPLIVHVAAELKSPRGVLPALATFGIVDPSKIPADRVKDLEVLLQHCWPGPLTVVLPKTSRVPDLVTSGLATVAVRMPKHPVAQALLRELPFPLAAPSANRFGRISPTSAQDVLQELDGRVPFILDGGPCEIGVESTVLALQPEGTWALLRPGRITREDLNSILKQPIQESATRPTGTSAAPAPGMLESHYAPKKQLYRLEKPLKDYASEDLKEKLRSKSSGTIGALTFCTPGSAHTAAAEIYPLGSDASCVAQNLFATLRKMDESVHTLLLCEPCPSKEGLWHAIQDRLTRASRPL